MYKTLEILKQNRQYLLQLVANYSFEQVNLVPKNFSNSIIWNMGHLLVTEKILTYGLCNLKLPLVSDEMINQFRKGTTPVDYKKEIWDEIKDLFLLSLDQTEADYKNGIFINFLPYTTSIGLNLLDIESAAKYIAYHEGIHAGVIQSIRKQFV